jgi:mono/diheme cytochrome c family protein
MRNTVRFVVLALIGSALLAAPTKHTLDSTKLDNSNKRTSQMSSVMGYLSKSHSGGIFIPPEGLFKCDNEAACEDKGRLYYKRIGVFDAAANPSAEIPTASRGTMQAWLATNGFSLNPTTPSPGEIRAVYYNRADLGFGRDLHCKSHAVGGISTESAVKDLPGISARTAVSNLQNLGGTIFACYVTNYGDINHPISANGNEQQAIQKAINNTAPIATVAMEVYRPNGGGGVPEVKFIVYDTGGIATSGFVPVPSALKGRALPFAILDNDLTDGGKKANPGTCLNCHGGAAPDPVDSANPTLNETQISGANFLPFDAQQFGYDISSASSPFSEASQRETMRKLNAFVKGTTPPSTAISAQIDGWYSWCSGVSTPGCNLDDQNPAHRYTPPSWKNAASITGGNGGNTQIVSLYQNVARKYCSTCHLGRSDDYDVQQFIGANPGNPNYDRIKSKLDPNSATSSMPLAERTFNQYWADSIAQATYNAIWGPVFANGQNPN